MITESEKLAGKVRLELTTCGFGDRCSSQLSYFPALENFTASARFFMHSVLALEGAVFLLFQAFRSVALFFGRRIVATFALSALHNYQFTSHIKHSTFCYWVYYDIIPDRHSAVRDQSAAYRGLTLKH